MHIAVVGATGVVGKELLSILEERRFPVASLRIFGSERSAGETLTFNEREYVVELLKEECFDEVEIAFFAGGSAVSKEWAAKATAQGAVVIDKSSLFRRDFEVPLVVPEVNIDHLGGYDVKKIIATPNCSTIQLVQTLAPLHEAFGLKRVICATYQAVSGAGKAGVDELDDQVRGLFNMRDDFSLEVFKQRIAFNVLPCIPGDTAFSDEGSTEEEEKMLYETRRILGLPDLKMSVTCARVPVFSCHSEAVHLEFERPCDVEEAREVLRKAPGIAVLDEPEKHLYPTGTDAAGEDFTFVGRVRKDSAFDHGLTLWVVSDNLRTGAALNAVRIAEALAVQHLCL
ncbi:MAG: aspartate-semialdehyde dehydrogenase [Deltaproteobacteria bacterium]|nr:aspartate-semialdehyde dehydrogenase [Deltaproteobacteria bacterium]